MDNNIIILIQKMLSVVNMLLLKFKKIVKILSYLHDILLYFCSMLKTSSFTRNDCNSYVVMM